MRLLLALCLLLAPLTARAQELTVFAAASLTDAMKDVSSSSLNIARQIKLITAANLQRSVSADKELAGLEQIRTVTTQSAADARTLSNNG